ncbi:hypothetical protein, partial [Bifidobacterium breve]|uniref:hypothetical protein n=1 Tax=Bifidobacterium breve TaxID=1685 RepID=UPI001F37B779
ACSGPAAYRWRPWTVMLPYLSAFILVHVTTSNGLAGRGSSAFRSSSVFCQIFVGRFGVSFSPFERLFLGRFGFGQSCGLSVIA